MNYGEIQDRAKAAVSDFRATRSGWARGKCPFCPMRVGSVDRRGSLAFWVKKGFVRCFRCGIKVWLSGYVTLDLPDDSAPTYSSGVPPWYWPLWGEVAETSVALAPGVAYAESRGFDVAIRRACRMGASLTGDTAERIIVPHRHRNGTWWGYSARSWIPKAQMPHKYPDGMSRDHLFNEQALDEETSDPVLLEEGALDGLLFWPDCVCSLGKPIEAHITTLKAAKRPIAVVLDGDAWREGESFSMRLRMEGLASGAVRLPPGRDPNDFRSVNPADIRRAAIESIGSRNPIRVQETCQKF